MEETLIALSISATVNPAAQMVVEKLKELPGCGVHITHIPTPEDEAGLRSKKQKTSGPSMPTSLLSAGTLVPAMLAVDQILSPKPLVRKTKTTGRISGQPYTGCCPIFNTSLVRGSGSRER